MKILKTVILVVFALFCVSLQANTDELEKLATVMREAQILIETRIFLRGLNEQRKNGTKIDKNKALAVADKAEQIAINGCECEGEQQNNVLRSQAYTLIAGIYGILSKDSRDIKLGKKSYHGLVKARELDPNNTDAIKGQAIALNMILAKGWLVSKIAAMALDINLEDSQRQLIHDLRNFADRKDLQRLADQLEDKL